MGKFLWICGLILLGIVNIYAQTNVKINIVLNHVQNLTIHPDQQIVNLNYNTLEDYRDGVHAKKQGHLSVFSTSPYEIKIKLANEKFIKLGGEPSQSIHMPEIKITPSTNIENQNLQFTTSSLVADGQKIITSQVPTISSIFNIEYTGPKGDSLIKLSEKNKTVTFYNDVLYSIETR